MINISSDLDISNSLKDHNYTLVPAHNFSFTQGEDTSREHFLLDWDTLKLDPYMKGRETYRFRRYGEFDLESKTSKLSYKPDAEFYQSLEANPVNGGIVRKFAPLLEKTATNPFLRALIQIDFKHLPDQKMNVTSWKVGVHQIRIRAVPGCPGDPTPEGIHRDDEKYTVQHLIRRHNITGGEIFFYGDAPSPAVEPVKGWLQKCFFDSYYFEQSI